MAYATLLIAQAIQRILGTLATTCKTPLPGTSMRKISRMLITGRLVHCLLLNYFDCFFPLCFKNNVAFSLSRSPFLVVITLFLLFRCCLHMILHSSPFLGDMIPWRA